MSKNEMFRSSGLSSLIRALAAARGKATLPAPATEILGLPQPHQLPLTQDVDLKDLNVLLISNSRNSLTQKVSLRLQSHGVNVQYCDAVSEDAMVAAANDTKPDVIVCPFLTKKVPEALWKNPDVPCLIVHPGIAGDRGMFSLDWAVKKQRESWGVTVLQAVEEMDAGDIWSTSNFNINTKHVTKSGLYGGDVSAHAMDAVVDALQRYRLGVTPTPLDYNHPDVCGQLHERITKKDRFVSWTQNADDIKTHVDAFDTQPGAICHIITPQGVQKDMRVYGATVETATEPVIKHLLTKGEIGAVMSHRHGAVLLKCGDGRGLWISHMKKTNKKMDLKLPSTSILDVSSIPEYLGACSYDDVTYHVQDGVCVLSFDFYNGAMSTDQCRRMERMILEIGRRDDVKMVVISGGERFFSTGIHLNVIEASPCPEQESWWNINAIDDVIRAMVALTDKVVISAIGSSAGAGGLMMALSADIVWARKGVLLTPTYKAMGLYGSEYWTYFLTQRVGELKATALTDSTDSILSETAHELAMVDRIFNSDYHTFTEMIAEEAKVLSQSDEITEILTMKAHHNPSRQRTIEAYRDKELEEMKKCFSAPQYEESRMKFVYH